jgi:hypothetical protein
MNIRFVIFLITIFMVFVPCYGMQVANNAVASDTITQIQNKNIEIKQKKSKINRKVWGILLTILGLVLVVPALLTLLILFIGIGISPIFPPRNPVVYLIGGVALLTAAIGGLLLLWADKLLKKRERHEEQDKKQGK